MAGYTRQSTFADGDTITAALFNNEYNQLLNAFSNTTGHSHDGTANEGPVIGLIGDAGETAPNNKVLIDTTNNYIEFYVQVSDSPVQQLYIADGAIIPVTDSDIDLGTTSLRFKDTYTDTVTTTGNVSIGGDLTVTGSATISGNLTFGDADTDSINLAAEIDSDIIPNTDGTYDLGSATKEWQDLYIDGTANIDSLVADTADINGGTIDGATIATSDITVGASKTLDVSSGTLTLADDQISGDKVEGGTIAATTITSLTATSADINGGTIDGSTIATSDITVGTGKTLDVSAGTLTLADNQISGDKVEGGTIAATTITDLTFGSLNDGTITITAFADEDDMSSDSATLVPTQQSVKAYVDSQVTAQDLDFQGDTGGALSIDLDSESLTIAGGTGIDTSGATNTLTVAIDSTVATLTGTQTLTNKTLTTPIISSISNTGTLTLPTSTDTLVGRATTDTLTNKTLTSATLTSPVINTGVSGTAFLDDDTFATATASTLASSESIKAYVDTTVAATNEVVEDTTPQLGGDLDLNSSDITGTGNINITGTIQSSGNITGTLATAAQTNITSVGALDGGSITSGFGSIDVGSSAITTTGTVTGNTLAGTLSTAAQPNITSVGTLTGLTTNGTTPTLLYGNQQTISNLQGLAIYNNQSGGLLDTTLVYGNSTNSYFAIGHHNGTSYTERFRIASGGDISFYEDTGTSPALFWDASAESLGIGTSSPSAKLDVNGDYQGAGNIITSSGFIRSPDGSAGTPSIQPGVDADTGFFRPTTNNIGFSTGGTERMRIDSSGNVGIGTTPASGVRLDMRSNAAATIGDFRNASATGFGLYVAAGDTSSQYAFRAADYQNNLLFTVQGDGNVGIGTSAPNAPLTIQTESGTGSKAGLRLNNPFGFADLNTGAEIIFSQDRSSAEDFKMAAIVSGQGSAGSSNEGYLKFFTRNGGTIAEKVRIDASGNLLVGTTSIATAQSPTSTGVSIRGPIGRIEVSADGTTSAIFNRDTSDGAIVNFAKEGSTVGSIDTIASTLHIGTSNCRLRFNSTAADIRPCYSTGLNYDAAIDLGDSGARFKDFYLSSSLYHGGARIVRKFVGSSGGSGIFPSLENSPQSGVLHVTEIGTTNYAIYALFKQDTASNVVTQLIANSGITTSATNALGTVSVTGHSTSSNVRMIATIIRED